jgi:hypothetical protein
MKRKIREFGEYGVSPVALEMMKYALRSQAEHFMNDGSFSMRGIRNPHQEWFDGFSRKKNDEMIEQDVRQLQNFTNHVCEDAMTSSDSYTDGGFFHAGNIGSGSNHFLSMSDEELSSFKEIVKTMQADVMREQERRAEYVKDEKSL